MFSSYMYNNTLGLKGSKNGQGFDNEQAYDSQQKNRKKEHAFWICEVVSTRMIEEIRHDKINSSMG